MKSVYTVMFVFVVSTVAAQPVQQAQPDPAVQLQLLRQSRAALEYEASSCSLAARELMEKVKQLEDELIKLKSEKKD